ncbi:MAG: hypothetical protein GTO45_27785 [Candidatus Aminicenantes bacterium]|nr:hypothetical protein [Candidatus Aminicenantes bacterium]NIM82603.1 hypothetical protein [Candidatus Aminicenantes bacterium]NIN21971.1 hypothetical protein [Candidatus Aminicenantes bacterium]NIN45733.1 hypothetical protein [Candidatus Aminicenantes bacterium]NIN88571.1 hypothetical protein [Candidatus Aminicenantes bacterium]
MRHLKHEDMARMIGGNVNKRVRKKFLKHLSRCESCSKVFTETLKFFEEEEKNEELVRLPAYGKRAGSRFREFIEAMFKKPALVPVLAAVIIILSVVPFLIIGPGPGSPNAKIENAKTFVSEIKGPGRYRLVEAKDIIDSAVCTGIIVEYLSMLEESPEEEDFLREITEILSVELRNIFKSETAGLFPDLANINSKNLRNVTGSIAGQLAARSLSGPFRFGRFLERTLLDTFEEKRPEAEEIDKYLQIARELEFPPGVVTRLKKLKEAGDPGMIRSLCKEIKKIFFE